MGRVVLHLHCAQPERRNPWTGWIDAEPSASPDRNWHERVLRESYHPNAYARLRDDAGQLERITNNYEHVSFDVAPTLMEWLERRHPRTYARILDADWRSQVRLGHGNAMAQSYHHVVLPLATPRDRRTEIRWGLADFRHRFRRDPAGMWLPAAAIDQDTADVLIEERVGLIVLAAHQAWQVRHQGGQWQQVGDQLDPSRPYRLAHSDGSGRFVAVFFAHPGLTRALAFDPSATASAEWLVDHLAAASTVGFASAAVEGETFGHHRPGAEQTLAAALHHPRAESDLTVTNFAAVLAAGAPVDEVRLPEGRGSSWSCPHQLGLWLGECGCGLPPGADGSWRAQLRQALDLVRNASHEALQQLGGTLLRDPWAARDASIGLRLGTVSAQDYFEQHCGRLPGDAERVQIRSLLEAERHTLAMYASEGLSVDDVGAEEVTFALRAADRVLGLLERLDVAVPREEVLTLLAQARSRHTSVGSAADVWRRHVQTAEVTPARVAAQAVMLGLVQEMGSHERVLGHDVELSQQWRDRRGRQALAGARVRVRAPRTGLQDDLAAVVLYLGGLDGHGKVGPWPGTGPFSSASRRLLDAFPRAGLPELIRDVEGLVEGELVGIDTLLPAARQEFTQMVAAELATRFRSAYSGFYGENQRLVDQLGASSPALPRDLRAAAELTLSNRLTRLVTTAAAIDGRDGARRQTRLLDEAVAEAGRAAGQGWQLDLSDVVSVVADATRDAAETLSAQPSAATLATLQRWLDLAEHLDLHVDPARAQEYVWESLVRARAGRMGPDQVDAIADAAVRLRFAPSAVAPLRR